MSKKIHKEIYRMREQGVDSTVFNDVVQEENAPIDNHPEDVIWDDDVLFDDSVEYQATNLKRRRYDNFRNVGDRHY